MFQLKCGDAIRLNGERLQVVNILTDLDLSRGLADAGVVCEECAREIMSGATDAPHDLYVCQSADDVTVLICQMAIREATRGAASPPDSPLSG